MSSNYQDDLTNLWAVGSKQTVSAEGERKPWYYTFCPGCGWKLTGKFSTCPRCGADLRMRTCPYCGGRIPITARMCPRCTADVE